MPTVTEVKLAILLSIPDSMELATHSHKKGASHPIWFREHVKWILRLLLLVYAHVIHGVCRKKKEHAILIRELKIRALKCEKEKKKSKESLRFPISWSYRQTCSYLNDFNALYARFKVTLLDLRSPKKVTKIIFYRYDF